MTTIHPRSTARPEQIERDAATRLLLTQAEACETTERERLLTQVVLLNRPVADSVARRFGGRGLDDDDLRQVAYEGLIKAVHRFDPGLGRDLASYAVPTIRGELQRHFRDRGWTVRPTRAVQDAQWRISAAEERLAQRLGRVATTEEIGAETGLSPDEYDAAMAAEGCFTPTSLDRPAGQEADGPALGDLLPDDTDEGGAAEARVMLAPAVRDLPRRAREVLFLRYYSGLTQREIGQQIGVTQTQVSRILTEVLASLRDRLGPDARQA